MPIDFSCPCGQTLRVPDERAGRKARCPKCQAVLTVPTAPEPAIPDRPLATVATAIRPAPRVDRPEPAPPAADPGFELLPEPARAAGPSPPFAEQVGPVPEPRRSPPDEPDLPPPRPRRRPKKGPARPAGGPNKLHIALVAAAAGFVLFGCLVCGGLGIYLVSESGPDGPAGGGPTAGGALSVFGGSTADGWLRGDWETDPQGQALEPGNADLAGFKLSFRGDHTFSMTLLGRFDGRWAAAAWDGTTARVEMTVTTPGFPGEALTITATRLGPDRMEYSDPNGSGLRVKLRRAGSATR